MTRLHRRATLVSLLLTLVFIGGPVPRAQAPTPNLQVEGDHFTINGDPSFLIFVSYFDALRAPAAWNSDLQWLSDHNISGVRIFPNWWHWCPTPTTAADDAVIGPSGNVNGARLQVLKNFLGAAAAHNIVVDISFSRGTVTNPPMTIDQYRTAMAYIAEQIAGYRNAIIDVGNEWNTEYSPGDVGGMVQAVKHGVQNVTSGDPTRAVTGSTTPGYADAGLVARTLGFDFAAPHAEGSDTTWFTNDAIAAQLTAVRNGLAPLVKPIHIQESPAFDPGCTNKGFDPNIGDAGTAVQFEKLRGAAGWTFHNRGGFDVAGTSLWNALTPAERTAIENLYAQAGTSWGVAAFAVSPSTINVGSAGGSSAIALTRLAGSTADWRASASVSWLHLSAGQGSQPSVGFTADPNPGNVGRSGAIDVSGRTVTVTQDPTPATTTHMSVDIPANGSVAHPPYNIAGWAIDTAATTGTGVDAVHVWAYPASGPPVFVGAATMVGDRPDVAAIYGSRFQPSGFAVAAGGLPAGTYQLAVSAHSTATGTFNQSQVVSITIPAPDVRGSIDVPAANATVSSPFLVGGWLADVASGAGVGIDTIHIYAYPNPGSGQPPIFLGVPTMQVSRPDVGAALADSRFTPSGYNLGASLSPGVYLIVVYPHSVVSNGFTAPLTVQVTVQ